MNKVFISYRRDDAQDAAGRISDRLSKEFGQDKVFMDVDNIPYGCDFREHLRNSVLQCDIFLAVIGEDWLDSVDSEGNRRIDSMDDFVRFEIELALKQKQTLVIPLLLHNTAVPHPDKLPGSLKELAYRNAVDIRHAHFQRDLDKLVEHLQKIPAETKAVDQIAVDSVTSSANLESTAVRPPALQPRTRRHAPVHAPTPPKREPRASSHHSKHLPINLGKLAIVVAAAVAVVFVAYILSSVFLGHGPVHPMIPE